MPRTNRVIKAAEDLDLDIDLEDTGPNEDEIEDGLEHDDDAVLESIDIDGVTDEDVAEMIRDLDEQKRSLIERSRKRGTQSTKGQHPTRETSAKRDARSRAPVREREINWTEASSLEAPPPREGMEQRWVRFQLGGKNDPRNWTRRSRGRWVPRSLESVDAQFAPPTISHGQLGEIIGVGDLILCERPASIGQARRKHFRQKHQRQVQAADRKHISRVERSDHPIKVSQKRDRPTVGRGTRQVTAQDD